MQVVDVGPALALVACWPAARAALRTTFMRATIASACFAGSFRADFSRPSFTDLAEDRFAPRIEEAKEQLSAVNTKLKGFIRENPGTSLLAAVGIGYLIGKLASRR